MKAGIIQPNYIPWRGYFDFIDDVDVFVFYDDVQYTTHDWRNRNRIKTAHGTPWLTVPVRHGSRQKSISEAGIDYSGGWPSAHLESFRDWYRRAPHFRDYYEPLARLLAARLETISDLDVALCRWIMEALGIRTQVVLASRMQLEGSKTARLLDALKKLGADGYLSGPAAKAYLDEGLLRDNGIRLEYKAYGYAPYPQLWGEFAPAVTALDLLFNTGPDARRHLKSLRSSEVAAS